MSPGNEKAARQGGSLRTDDNPKLLHQGGNRQPTDVELWPKNVELLRSKGIQFEWRKAEHDIRVCCPHCAGTMTLHESEPWHLCIGPACQAHLFKFSEIITALPTEQAEVEK